MSEWLCGAELFARLSTDNFVQGLWTHNIKKKMLKKSSHAFIKDIMFVHRACSQCRGHHILFFFTSHKTRRWQPGVFLQDAQ